MFCVSLCRHIRSHFHLPVTLAGVMDGDFKAFGGFIGDPVRAALVADKGRHVTNDNHAEAEVNGKGGCAFCFISAANGTIILFTHDFLRVR